MTTSRVPELTPRQHEEHAVSCGSMTPALPTVVGANTLALSLQMRHSGEAAHGATPGVSQFNDCGPGHHFSVHPFQGTGLDLSQAQAFNVPRAQRRVFKVCSNLASPCSCEASHGLPLP